MTPRLILDPPESESVPDISSHSEGRTQTTL